MESLDQSTCITFELLIHIGTLLSRKQSGLRGRNTYSKGGMTMCSVSYEQIVRLVLLWNKGEKRNVRMGENKAGQMCLYQIKKGLVHREQCGF